MQKKAMQATGCHGYGSITLVSVLNEQVAPSHAGQDTLEVASCTSGTLGRAYPSGSADA